MKCPVWLQAELMNLLLNIVPSLYLTPVIARTRYLIRIGCPDWNFSAFWTVISWQFSFILVSFPVHYFIQGQFHRPPLWSSDQSSWQQIQRFRVRFPALPDLLRISGSGTGSTQPREDDWGATWIEKQRPRFCKIEINESGDPLRWPRDTLYPQKLALTSPTCGGRSVGIVRLRNKATEFFLV
jgi:hypothetical protein